MSVRNILDGTIPVGGSIPEELTVKRVIANHMDVKGAIVFEQDNNPEATKLMWDQTITPNLYAEIVSASTGVTTPLLTLGGDDVLVSTNAQGNKVLVGTLASDGNGVTTMLVSTASSVT